MRQRDTSKLDPLDESPLKGFSHPARGIHDVEEAIAAIIESKTAGELSVRRIGFGEVHAGIMYANVGILVALEAVSPSAYQTVTTVGACQFVTIECNQARDIPDLVPGRTLLRQQKASAKVVSMRCAAGSADQRILAGGRDEVPGKNRFDLPLSRATVGVLRTNVASGFAAVTRTDRDEKRLRCGRREPRGVGWNPFFGFPLRETDERQRQEQAELPGVHSNSLPRLSPVVAVRRL